MRTTAAPTTSVVLPCLSWALFAACGTSPDPGGDGLDPGWATLDTEGSEDPSGSADGATGSTDDGGDGVTAGTDGGGQTEDGATTGDDDGVGTGDGDAAGTGDGDGDGATVGDGDGAACHEQTFAVEIVRPQVGLVLDHSGSMNTDFTTYVTRWQALHDTTLDLVERYGDRADFGVVVFPAEGLGHWCDEPVGPELPIGPHGVQDVEWAIPSRVDPAIGGTPLVTAFELAATMITDSDPTRPRALVVIADGGVSACAPGDDADAVASVAAELRATELTTTFVIGIGDEAVELDVVAAAGGTGAVLPVEDDVALHAALEGIVGEAVDCELRLEAPIPANGELILRLASTELQPDDACVLDGWRTTGPDTIELCGVSCDAYREGASVELELICGAE